MVNINFEIRSDELHRAFKVKCINRGWTLENRLNDLMERDVEEA
jgi:hypothetical protein